MCVKISQTNKRQNCTEETKSAEKCWQGIKAAQHRHVETLIKCILCYDSDVLNLWSGLSKTNI